MSAYTQGTPQDCFVWEVPGKPIAVHLSLDVVDHILPDVMRGFSAVPKRGAEVGGILLGTIERLDDKTIVHVEACEIVPCEYKHGPSYFLSEGDLAAFEEACFKWENATSGIGPVGFYRSDTREGFTPASEDLDLCSNFFPDPAQVFLLIKPHATRPSVAGFFFYESGRFQESTYLEFPFRRRELSGSEPEPRRPLGERLPAPEGGLRRVPLPSRLPMPDTRASEPQARFGAAAAGPPNVEVSIVPSRMPFPRRIRSREAIGEDDQTLAPRKRGFRWVWVPIVVIFVAAGFILGFQAAASFATRTGGSTTAAAYTVGLGVRRTQDTLDVTWERAAPAVKLAQNGVLEIRDGRFTKTVELDPTQLQTGSIIYRNISGEVNFRLEVHLTDHSTLVESASWKRE